MSRKDREAIESERHDLTGSLMEHIGDLLVKVRTYVQYVFKYICAYVHRCVTTSMQTTWIQNGAPLGQKLAQVL